MSESVQFGCPDTDTAAETANKLRGIATKQFCSIVTVQLGRWRACCLSDGEVKTLKLDETDLVPVILHSSYVAGILTVEGLDLTKATIQIASKHGDKTSGTKSNEVSEPGVDVSGAGVLEIHTCL